ncbi:hypothetical protein OS187_03355 [Xanthomonadaceae bacterium JHOS43]|nr:hypothetical protein [Xanthomonadaceae bacterium JHOS43]
MKRMLRWSGIVLLSMLALGVVLFAVARLSGPTSVQRSALALLDADEALPGRNAFPLLWLLDYDVPASQWMAIVEEDVARIEDALARREAGEAMGIDHQSVAAGRFARISSDTNAPPYCRMRDADCLTTVRAGREAYALRLEKERALLDKLRSLPDYGHYRNLFPPNLYVPMPRFQALGMLGTANALDFVEGRTDAALAATCRETMAWRRLSVHGDSLIVAMIGAAMVNGNAQLFAQMLAELPREHPLPAECTGAFDPATLSPDLCPAMRGEARYATWMLQSRESQPSNPFAALLYDPEGTRAMLAPTHAYACTDEAREHMLADMPIPPAPQPDSLWRLECADNIVGCVLADIAAPAYVDYLGRMQDVQAMLRVMHLMLELRAGEAPLTPQTLAARLEADAVQGRRIEYDPESARLGIDLRGQHDSPRWQVPLPASMLPPSDDAGADAQGHAP